MFRSALVALGLCVALVTPVSAQTRVEDLIRIDVIDGGTTARGTHLTALRLTMADGWKTYWRKPGEAGIPPEFSWRGSRNIGAVSISWPTPVVFDQNGMQSIGYKNQLVLPVEVTAKQGGKPVRLRGAVEFGICKDVCIPGKLKFDHEVDTAAGRHPAIAAALAQRPFSASEAGVRGAVCKLMPAQGGVRIEARITMPSAGGPEVAVIEPGNPQIWASEATTRRQGDTLIATSDLVHVQNGGFALDRSQVRITILGKRHAVDIRGCAAG